MASDSIPPDEPTRQRNARPWRLVTIGGGLLLVISFFLPMTPFAPFGSGGMGSAASAIEQRCLAVPRAAPTLGPPPRDPYNPPRQTRRQTR